MTVRSTICRPRYLFSPQCHGGLSLWLDAADQGAMTVTAGAITNWFDKSGRSHDFAEPTNPPAWSATGFNSALPGVTFDGTNDILQRSEAWMYTAGTSTVYIVLTCGSPVVDATFISEGSTSSVNPSYAMIKVSNSVATTLVSSITGDTGTPLGNTPTTGTSFSSSPALLVRNDTGTNVIGRKNGATSNTASYTRVTTTLNCSAIGARARATPDRFAPCTMAEILVLTGQSPDLRETNLFEGYLGWKWGIALPAGHPWSTSPP